MSSNSNLYNFNQKKAQCLFYQAYSAQSENDYQEAIRLYQASIEVFPTAEAHTFLGWAYSFFGDLESAIGHCEKAILLDPGFGNSYNDIGAYLIAQGKFEDAFWYLLKALSASRYRARHYAYFNLARVYEYRNDLFNAYRYYRLACQADSSYVIAYYALERLKAKINATPLPVATQSKKAFIKP